MPVYCPLPSLNYLNNIANFILQLKAPKLEDIDILVPDAYAANALQEELLKLQKSDAFILPKIFPIQKIDFCQNSLILSSEYQFSTELQSRLFIAEAIVKFSNGQIELDEAILMSKSLLLLFGDFIKAAKVPNDLGNYFDPKFGHASFLKTFLSKIYHDWINRIELVNKIEPVSYLLGQINTLTNAIDNNKYSRCLISVGLLDEFLYGLLKTMINACHIVILPPTSLQQINSNHLIERLLNQFVLTREDIIILGETENFTNDINEKKKNLKYFEAENLQETFDFVITTLASCKNNNKSFAIVSNNLNLAQILKTVFLKKASIKNTIGCSFCDNAAVSFILLVSKLFSKPLYIKDFLMILKHPYVLQNTYDFELFLAKNNLQIAYLDDVVSIIVKNFPNIYQIYIKLISILNIGNCKLPANILLNHTLTAAESIVPGILSFEGNEVVRLYMQDLLDLLKHFDIHTSKYFPIINLLFSEKYNDVSQENDGKANIIKIIAPRHIIYTEFDYCIVPEFVSSIWPDNYSKETWLPSTVQKDFGLERVEEKILYLYQSYFDYLCFSKGLVLVKPKKLGDSYTKLPYYISDASRKEILIKDECSSLTFEEKEVYFEFNNVFPDEISATQIDELINNPYSFYVKKILNLNYIDFFKFETRAGDFGTFIHKAIDLYTKSTFKGVNTFISIAKNLFKFYKQDGNIWWNEKIEHIANEFCLLEKTRHALLEKSFSEEYGYMYINLPDKKKVKVICKADKIEVFPNYINIIDYKTGSVPTLKSIKDGKSMQLVIAALIVKYGSFPKVSKEFNLRPVNLITYIKLNNFEPYWQVIDIEIDNDFLHKKYSDLVDLFTSFTKVNAKYKYFDNLYSDCKHLSRILGS
jgi:ATP-dependent helicase/nuclease subunit B